MAAWSDRLRLLAVAVLALFPCGSVAFLLGVDFGSQFFKVAVVAPGKPFEVVHNQHSKRKTPTSVSFVEKVRTFGDDALASAARGAAKTPQYFPLLLGVNHSGSEADLHWLPTNFYPYSLGLNESGSLRFNMGDEQLTVQEVAGHVLGFAKGLAEQELGFQASETVITIPSLATMLERRARLDAAEIGQLPRAQLIHEISAAALQRGLDLDLSGNNGTQNESTVLFYNMGARHTEACIVAYRGATHQGKPTVSMDLLGCGAKSELGGHQVDLLIAQKMLAAFQQKYPKLAEGIAKYPRALKKLEKEAAAMKHVLSANKEAQFRVESLYEDTDFMQQVNRETFEEWCSAVFAMVSQPIEAALVAAGTSVDAVDAVEMIGGGWRIPRVQSLLTEYFKAQRSQDAPALVLSQHVNGDEAMATGAAFFGANSSVSFRTKKVFFTDVTPHSYALVLKPLNSSQPHEEGWERGVSLFAAPAKLRSKKTVKLNVAFDIHAVLLENGIPILKWDFAGIHEAATGKYANLSTPLISLKFELDSSGVIQVSSAQAIFDEPVPEAPAAFETNGTGGEDAAGANATAGDADGAGRGADQSSDSPAEDAASTDMLSGDLNVNETDSKKPKMKKRKVTLSMSEHFSEISPRPLTMDEKLFASGKLAAMDLADLEVRKTDAAKNTLESFVYDSRAKLNDDEGVAQVSTEENRTAIIELMTSTEDWLYSDEASEGNASLFQGKLEELEGHMFPILRRAHELEQRPALPELVEKVLEYATNTLEYVRLNMTWVSEKERTGVMNLTEAFNAWYANVTEQQAKLSLTEEPAFYSTDVKRALQKVQSEAQRLTRIQKIDYDYSKYGNYGGYGGYDDPKMRAYYEAMRRNFSNFSDADWMRNFSNFSNFSGWNDSDYYRSYYEHFAKNFSQNGTGSSGGSGSSGGAGSSEGGAGADGDRTEL